MIDPDPGNTARLRAFDLIEMLLHNKASEADALLSTVPDGDLRFLVEAALVTAAEGFRAAVGTAQALHVVRLAREESTR